MSDEGQRDPTRPQRPADEAPEEPTAVIRTPGEEATAVGPAVSREPPPAQRTTTTETVPADRPPAGAVSTGAAVAGAIAALLIGLLAGFLIFEDDDTESATVDDTVVDDGRIAALEAERDELAGQVAERDGRIAELQAQLDEAAAERDALQAQLDEADDAPATVPAPDVVGGSVDEARDVASENGWTLVEREADAPGTEPGTVTAQQPQPDTAMVEGSVLVVDVATEPGSE